MQSAPSCLCAHSPAVAFAATDAAAADFAAEPRGGGLLLVGDQQGGLSALDLHALAEGGGARVLASRPALAGGWLEQIE